MSDEAKNNMPSPIRKLGEMAKASKTLPDTFALRVIKSSMEPAYSVGNLIVVDLRKPIKDGKDYVFITSREGIGRLAQLARLESVSEKFWHVRFLAGEKTLCSLDRSIYPVACRVASVWFDLPAGKRARAERAASKRAQRAKGSRPTARSSS